MSKKFRYGDEIIKFLEKYGYNKRGEDFEQFKDSSTVTYMYAIPKGMRPQTPYVEFTVDADNDAFIMGEFFTDGRKGYSTQFDSVEDLEYFIANANYSNVDLTEKKLKEFRSDVEVDYEPHSGVYSIELNDNWVIGFAPKENLDLSGWQITSYNGDLAEYTNDWENSSYEEIEKDINRLYKILPNYINNKAFMNDVIGKIKEMCLK